MFGWFNSTSLPSLHCMKYFIRYIASNCESYTDLSEEHKKRVKGRKVAYTMYFLAFFFSSLDSDYFVTLYEKSLKEKLKICKL